MAGGTSTHLYRLPGRPGMGSKPDQPGTLPLKLVSCLMVLSFSSPMSCASSPSKAIRCAVSSVRSSDLDFTDFTNGHAGHAHTQADGQGAQKGAHGHQVSLPSRSATGAAPPIIPPSMPDSLSGFCGASFMTSSLPSCFDLTLPCTLNTSNSCSSEG